MGAHVHVGVDDIEIQYRGVALYTLLLVCRGVCFVFCVDL